VSVSARFWAKVDKNGDCWEWMANTRKGYGSIKVSGISVYAHRLSWEMQNGPLQNGMLVLHKCDNPRCVNPSHLFVGTQKDNMEDREAKDRGADRRGNKNGRSKIPQAAIALILASKESLSTLALKYGVSKTAIRLIKIGKNWSHL
jgi:hypothetical protein